MSNDSMTGLTSSWRHMASTRWAAADSLSADSSMLMSLPMRTSATSAKPEIVEAAADGQPLRVIDAGVELDRHPRAEELGRHPASNAWASR